MMRIFRRILAISLLPIAILAGIAGLTASIGDKVPPLAQLGLAFDGTAAAEVEGAVILASTMADPALRSGASSPAAAQSEQKLLEAFRAEPLNRAGLRSMALIMRQRRDARYDDFVDAALMASPRTPSLVGLALENAARDGENTYALNLLDRLMRLRPSTVRELMPRLVEQLEQNPDVAEMEQILRREPLWAPIFFSLAADSDVLLPIVARIRTDMGQTTTSNELIDARYIRNLAAAGDFDAAWRIFRLQRPSAGEYGLQFDTQFAPFDWTLSSGAAQTASLLSGDILEIDLLNGGGNAARQVLRLSDEPRQIEGSVTWEGDGTNDLVVSAACADAGAVQEIARLSPGQSRLAAALPRGCRYVNLVIATERSYATVPTIVTLRGLRIG